MKNAVRLSFFAVLVIAQLAVPAWMIVSREWTLRQGNTFKFHTAPVDPYDPFRGRYVALRLEPDEARAPVETQLDYNQRMVAVLETDAEGYAKVSELRLEPPPEGDFIRVHAWPRDATMVGIHWPFDRYYMDERLAPEAEKAYRDHNLREERNAHVTVRVRSGNAVLEDLFIENVPVREYVLREMKEK